jgi:hypothetical protein
MCLSVLSLAVAVLCIYAWKDWFKILCSLILFVAVFEDKDNPSGMFDIQGINAWDIFVCRGLAGRVFDLRIYPPSDSEPLSFPVNVRLHLDAVSRVPIN